MILFPQSEATSKNLGNIECTVLGFITKGVIKSHNFNVVTHIATHNMSQKSWKLKPYILHICYNKHLHDLYCDYYDLENYYYWYFHISILSYIVSLFLTFVSHWCAQVGFRASNT